MALNFVIFATNLIDFIIFALVYKNLLGVKYPFISIPMFVTVNMITYYLSITYLNLTMSRFSYSISVLILLHFFYKSSIYRKVLSLGFYMLFVMALDYIMTLFLFGREDLIATNISLLNQVFINIMGIVVDVIPASFLMIMTFRFIDSKFTIDNKALLFSFLPIGQYYAILCMNLSGIEHRDYSMLIMGAVAFVLFIITDILVYIAVSRMQKQTLLEERLKNSEELLKAKIQYDTGITEIEKRTREYRHDLKNQLYAVVRLLEDGRSAEADFYMTQLSDELNLDEPIVFCSNTLLNALLKGKYDEAKRENINCSIRIEADLNESSGINPLHICSVFSNLIDNSIEACMKSTDKNARKYIDVHCTEKAGHLFIKVENSVFAPAITHNGKFLSAKQGEFDHGLGIEIVRNIVKRYSGDIDIQNEDKSFTVMCMLKLEAPAVLEKQKQPAGV